MCGTSFGAAAVQALITGNSRFIFLLDFVVDSPCAANHCCVPA